MATPDGMRAWIIATGSLTPDANEQDFALHAVVTGAGPWAVLGPIAGVDPN